jgi:hypothetical protein
VLLLELLQETLRNEPLKLLVSLKELLNSTARSYLQAVDYRIYSLLIVLTVIGFLFWRRRRYDSWPSAEQCINLVIDLLAIIGAFTIGLVFLLTKPPAIELLPAESLALIGLIVPIIVIGYALSKLRGLFFPPQAPKPVQNAELSAVRRETEGPKPETPAAVK